MTVRTFRPMLNSGVVYARPYGSAQPMIDIGGISELKLAINEDVKKQTDFAHTGGGTRAQVNRIKEVMMDAKLQDLNPINLARAVFGTSAEVAGATVTAEARVAFKGGLIRLAHPNPTTVVVKKGATVIAALANYEVRPEGIYILETSVALTDADAITVDYAYGGYDVIQALNSTAPTLEMAFGGVNEADNGAAVIVDIWKVKLGATNGINLITADFAELDIKGEVLADPTKGGGISRFFRAQMA